MCPQSQIETPPRASVTRIIDILISEKLVTEEQLRYAQRAHAKLSTSTPLLDVLVELDYVTTDQIRALPQMQSCLATAVL